MSDTDVYTLIEARAQDLIQALSEFASASVLLGDPRGLDSGAPPYVFLTAGPLVKPRLSPRSVDASYDIDLALVVRHHHDGTEWTNLKSNRYALTNMAEKYPTMNKLVSVALGYQVVFADIARGDRPYSLPPEHDGGLSQWLIQEMTWTVQVVTVIDGGEYG